MDALTQIPPKARALTALGDETTKTLLSNFSTPQTKLFTLPEEGQDFSDLASALRSNNWSDKEASNLLAEYFKETKSGREIDLKLVEKWVIAHPNDASAVLDCMKLEPPIEIDIIKVLSRRGSQKLVFLANWRLRLQEVVLKKIFGNVNEVDKILSRELQGHPLNFVHPNIIETFSLINPHGEKFLIERKLQEVLSDKWRANGINEAANLLSNIASALKFLHDNDLVHGDVKPDNIGKRADQYVLLDLGICRPKHAFSKESTPTGSIRTRAPELLIEEQYILPEMVDVWALGATIYNSLAQRYPLISAEEDIPRVFDPQERDKFEKKLALRATKEWDKWVDFNLVPAAMRKILSDMLERDPRKRISTSDLIKRVKDEFAAFLRVPENTAPSQGKFSPLEELDQIGKYLSKPAIISLLPHNKKIQLQSRLKELNSVPGFSEENRTKIQALITQL